MSIELRLPNITASDQAGQVRQLRSYLYQLVEELNWALSTVEQRSPKTEDNSSSTSAASKEEAALDTFSSIKSLIIKSADIINAYYEVLNERFAGQFVAQSTFGTYQEQTEQEILKNSTGIQQNLTNIQTLTQGQQKLGTDLAEATADMARIEKVIIGVNAYINSGLLYYEEGTGIPVYGIEVGQRTEVNGEETFNKYARFTSNKLSFYDSNDNEVAYVSDYKLYITNVEVTGSFRIGKLVTTVQSDGSLVRKFVR